MSAKREKPYYYSNKGETEGPFTVSQMKEFYDAGMIFADTNVWSKGMPEWLPLSQSPIKDKVISPVPVPAPEPAVPIPPPPPPKRKQSGAADTAQPERRRSTRRISLNARDAGKLSPPGGNRVTSIADLRRASRRLSRRNPSQCFIEEFEPGALIWVEDSEVVWKLCQVIRSSNAGLEVELVEDRKTAVVDTNFQETHRHNPNVVPDMTSLHYLHEASIMYNLGVRAAEHLPYTYMGSVLIAVNPLQEIPLPSMSMYNDNAARQAVPPHPYALAATCIHQLNSSAGLNQSVVISGESGAGKTETAKIILNYLVQRANSHSGDVDESGQASLDARLIQSSHVLESFGNAATSKNANSSRFGKFMKIYFSPANSPLGVGKLLGAAIETYLLEKSRVATQYLSERNYHVFYQLVSACVAIKRCEGLEVDGLVPSWQSLIPEDVREVLSLGVSSFSILSEPATDFKPDDLARFIRLSDSLETLDIDTSVVSELWTVLCGVLSLGNVTFGEKDSPEGPVAYVEDFDVCAAAAQFLGVDKNGLHSLVTQRTMTTRGEQFTIRLTRYDAGCSRDAICKQVYEGLFSLLVKAMNAGMANEDIIADSDAPYSHLRFIGVLDVFGFESFENNDFEQLLINFANEHLQDTFNVQVFQAELRLFQEENIHCAVTNHPDNKECVDLIAGKPSGIFAILDNICKLPKPSDEKFCEELHSTFARHRYFPQTHPKDKKNTFWIKHYAGNVKYTVWSAERNGASRGQLGETNQWVMKNNDSNPDGLVPLLRASSFQSVQLLYPESRSSRLLTKGESFANYKWGGDFNSQPDRDRGASTSTKASKATIASSFVQSMAGLNALLLSTQCSFIRCIKPNAQMKCGLFDNSFVVHQIRCLGLVQACEILRIGLPHRISYVDLKEAVSYILEEALEIFKDESEEVFIASLFYAFEVPPEAYRLGRTRAFFRTGQLAALEGMLSDGAELRRDEIIARLYEALEIRREARILVETCAARVLAAEENILQLKRSYDLVENASFEPTGSFTSLASAHMTSANYEFSVYQRLIEDVKEVFMTIQRDSHDIDAADKNSLELDAISIATIQGKPEINDDLLRLARSCCEALAKADSTYQVVARRMEDMKAADCAAKEGTDMHTVVAEMWDHLIRLDELLQSGKLRSQEVCDGALRCQAEYTTDRAVACEDVLRSIDVVSTETNKLLQRAHSIVAGDYGGHRKTQLIADEIVDLCLREASAAQVVFVQCKELLSAKTRAVEIHRQETMSNMHDANDLVEEETQATSAVRSVEDNSTIIVESKATIVSVPTGGGSSFKTRGKYAALSAIRKKIASHAKLGSHSSTEHHTQETICVPEEPEPEEGILPDGWAQYKDESRGIPYYFNLLTQQTQWERPAEAAMPVEEKEEDSVHPHGSDDHSFAASDDGMSMHSEEDDIRVLDDVYVLPKPEAGLSRELSMRAGSMRITPDEFERVGMTLKTGILMKRSKYLKLWKKRFVVLEDSKLIYYKKSQDYNAGLRSDDKTMTLTPESMTSFTTVKNVFSIKQRDPLSTGVGESTGSRVRKSVSRTSKSEQWFLMAKDDFEMHEWVTAISAHIHVVHMMSANYQKTRDDYLRMGTAAVSFWVVPKGKPGSQKLPIGIRTIPEFSGPRTGEGLYPGEVVEVIHSFDVFDEDGAEVSTNSFLKLADDRGWVFQRHPKTSVPLLSLTSGRYDFEEFRCTYGSNQATLHTVLGPSGECRRTGAIIQPGENFAVCATYRLDDSAAVRGSGGIAFPSVAVPVEYYKLKDGRGWVPSVDEHGTQLFTKNVTRQNPLFARKS